MGWDDSFPNLEDKAPKKIQMSERSTHKRQHDLTRSGPRNGPDNQKYRKQEEIARWPGGKDHIARIFDVYEAQGPRKSQQKHMDHNCEEGYVSEFHLAWPVTPTTQLFQFTRGCTCQKAS